MALSVVQMEELVEQYLGGQKRRDGTSNAQHAKRVRTVLLSALAQTQERPADALPIECGALGHDLLEDSPVDRVELQALVGDEAYAYIVEMTNTDGDGHTEGYVRQMVAASEEARLIKYADLTDNLFHASYQAKGLGNDWMRNFFLPIVDPMREALSHTTFLRYPKTAALLRRCVELARAHLAESMK